MGANRSQNRLHCVGMLKIGGSLVALLMACQSPLAEKATVAVRGLRAALTSQALGDLVIADAALAVACDNGTFDQAHPLPGSLDPIFFTAVGACGAATLTLTVHAATAAGSVTAYVGKANAKLSPGEVSVTFAGPLYGEVEFTSIDGESFACSEAGVAIAVPAAGAVVPLPVGDHTLTCSGPVSGAFSLSFTISEGARGQASLPPNDPRDATLASLTASFGALQPAFSASVTDYTLLLSSRRTDLLVTATASSPGASVSGTGPASLVNPLVDQPVALVVTSANGQVTQTYTIHVLRGLVTDLSVTDSDVSANFLGMTPPAFSWSMPRYDLTDRSGSATPNDWTLTVGVQPGAAFSVSGVPGPSAVVGTSGVPMAEETPGQVESITLIEATAPGGETDSYWLRFFNNGGAAEYFAAYSAGPNAVDTSQVFDSAPISTATSGVGITQPFAIAIAPGQSDLFLYIAGDAGSAGSIGWLAMNSANVPPTLASSGASINVGKAAMSLIASDPKGRFIVAASFEDLYLFAIDPVTGNLTLRSTFATTNITALAVDPLGRFIFIALSGGPLGDGLLPFFIHPDGTLEAGAFLPTPKVLSLSISPNGDVALIAGFDASFKVSLTALAIDASSGALTSAGALSGEQLGLGPVGISFVDAEVGIDPSNNANSIAIIMLNVATASTLDVRRLPDFTDVTSQSLTNGIAAGFSPLNVTFSFGDDGVYYLDTNGLVQTLSIDAVNGIVEQYNGTSIADPLGFLYFADWFGPSVDD